MTTGRINQVFLLFCLILFLFQYDLLLLFREQISLLLRNVPRFVSFFLSFSVFLSLRQAYDYWQDQPGFLLFCFLSPRSFLFFLSFCFLLSQFFLFLILCSAFRFIFSFVFRFSFFETSI